MSFSRQPNPVWVFFDLTGLILDDNYYAHFLTNEAPYLPQNVYQDADGDVVWDNPLQFYANGTLPNNLYFNENLVYRIEIRRGATQSDPLIYEINNFVPLKGSSDDVFSLPTDNQITNPQFSEVYFEGDYAIVNAGTNTYTIAPGWYLTLEGAATMTLTQQAYEGDANEVGNPSFGLRMVVTGTFDDVKLYQRFNHAPAIWARQAVCVTLAGLCNDANRSFTVTYTPSSGTDTLVLSEQLTEGNLDLKFGSVFLPDSDSADTGADGYVDIVFDLPNQGDYELTNIQVVGAPQRVNLPYAQTTVERQTDQTFNVFKDSLLRQPKANLLTGWTFGLNPWQFRDTASSNVATNTYTADQTVVIQQAFVTSATGNNVAVGRATAAQNYAFEVTAVTNANKAIILQYIDPQTIRPYWGEKLSVRVRGLYVNGTVNTPLRFKVRLMYKAGLPGTIAQTVPVSVWANTDDALPTVSGDGWTMLTSNNDPTYTLSTTVDNYDFDGFQLPVSSSANMTLGIMIIPMNNLDATGTPGAVRWERVSLVRNDFALDADPETFAESLAKCQYYYEKSYEVGTLPGTVGSTGAIFQTIQWTEIGGAASLARKAFFVNFQQIKRVAPSMTFYLTTTGANGSIIQQLQETGGATNSVVLAIGTFSVSATSTSRVAYIPNTAGEITSINPLSTNVEAMAIFHYGADSRLGLV